MAADIREWRRRATLADSKLRHVEEHWTKAKAEISELKRVNHIPGGLHDTLNDTLYCLATSVGALKRRSRIMARFGARDWIADLTLHHIISTGIGRPRGTETGNRVLERAVMSGILLMHGLHDTQESVEIRFGIAMGTLRYRVNEVLIMALDENVAEVVRVAAPMVRLLDKMDRWRIDCHITRSRVWRDLEAWKLEVMRNRKYFLLLRATMDYATLSAMSTVSTTLGLRMARQRLITEFMDGQQPVAKPLLKSCQDLQERDEAVVRPQAKLQMNLKWWFRPKGKRKVVWWRRAEDVLRRKVRAMRGKEKDKVVVLRQAFVTEYFPVIARRITLQTKS